MKNHVIKRFMPKKLRRLLKARVRRKRLALKTSKPVISPEPTLMPSPAITSSWSEIATRLKIASQVPKKPE